MIPVLRHSGSSIRHSVRDADFALTDRAVSVERLIASLSPVRTARTILAMSASTRQTYTVARVPSRLRPRRTRCVARIFLLSHAR